MEAAHVDPITLPAQPVPGADNARTVAVRSSIVNRNTGVSSMPTPLDGFTEDTTWGELKQKVTEGHDKVVGFRINGRGANYLDVVPLKTVLGDDDSLLVEVISAVEPTSTEQSLFFEPEEITDARRESTRYLAKVEFPNGNVKPISGHSYDRMEEPNGVPGAFVDQLATSSVRYIVEGTNESQQSTTVELSSQQCLLVDREGHDPYILLSNSGRKALDDIAPIGFLKVVMDPRPNAVADGRDAQPNANANGNRQRPRFGEGLVDYFRHFVRTGALNRIFAYISTLMMRYFPLALFAVIMDYSSWYVLLALAIIVVSLSTCIEQLEEIVRLDLPESMRPRMLQVVWALKVVSNSLEHLNLRGIGTRVVNFGLGNDRPGLAVGVGQQGLVQRVETVFRDIVLALATLVPSWFAIFNYEIVRRRHLVTRAEAAEAAEETAGNDPAETVETAETAHNEPEHTEESVEIADSQEPSPQLAPADTSSAPESVQSTTEQIPSIESTATTGISGSTTGELRSRAADSD